jgi:hypothetical protein
MKNHKALIAIWVLAIVSAVFAYLFINGKIFALEVNKSETMTVIGEQYNPQKTISGYKLQPTVSDAYMQWGDNPQRTAPAKVLETAKEIR